MIINKTPKTKCQARANKTLRTKTLSFAKVFFTGLVFTFGNPVFLIPIEKYIRPQEDGMFKIKKNAVRKGRYIQKL